MLNVLFCQINEAPDGKLRRNPLILSRPSGLSTTLLGTIRLCTDTGRPTLTEADTRGLTALSNASFHERDPVDSVALRLLAQPLVAKIGCKSDRDWLAGWAVSLLPKDTTEMYMQPRRDGWQAQTPFMFDANVSSRPFS